MSDYTDVLERIGDRVAMPEPALDRMVRRRERRDQNRRVAAGALGLVITILLVLALSNVRPRATQQPAETPTPPAENGWIAYTLAGEGIFFVEEGGAPRLAVGAPGDDEVERCPTFSPEGSRLAFTRQKGAASFGIFVVDISEAGVVADSERFIASSEGEYWACPEWSPDGTKLLYSDHQAAWTVDTEQGEPPVLLTRFDDIVDIGWSPDGTRVAGLSRVGRLWVVSAADGTDVMKARSLHNATFSWSPSGDRIVVAHGNTGFRAPPSVIDVESGEHEELTAAGRRFVLFGDPEWSPNGAIALEDHDDGIGEGIVIVRPDEDTWYRIPLDPEMRDTWGLRWSPDGRRLLAASGCSVYSTPAEGGGWTLVSSPTVDPERCQLPPGLAWQPVFP